MEVFECPMSRFFLDEHQIIHVELKRVLINTDMARAHSAFLRSKIQVHGKLIMIRIPDLFLVQQSSILYLSSASNIKPYRSLALVVGSAFLTSLVNSSLFILRPIRPILVFTKEKNAIKWLLETKNYSEPQKISQEDGYVHYRIVKPLSKQNFWDFFKKISQESFGNALNVLLEFPRKSSFSLQLASLFNTHLADRVFRRLVFVIPSLYKRLFLRIFFFFQRPLFPYAVRANTKHCTEFFSVQEPSNFEVNKDLYYSLMKVFEMLDAYRKEDFSKTFFVTNEFLPIQRLVEGIEVLGQELKAQTEALRKQQALLKETATMTSLGRMSSMVYHELNNPLFLAKGFYEMIEKRIAEKNGEIDYKLRDALSHIQDGIKRMHLSVSCLRDFSKRNTQRKEELFLPELFSRAVAIFSESLNLSSIELCKEADPQNCVFQVNSSRMMQVFILLLSTAKEALENTDCPRKIHVRFEIEEKNFLMHLEYNAVNEQKETLDDLLSETSASIDFSILQEILEEHGGEIFCSEGTCNTEYILQLPLKHQIAV